MYLKYRFIIFSILFKSFDYLANSLLVHNDSNSVHGIKYPLGI